MASLRTVLKRVLVVIPLLVLILIVAGMFLRPVSTLMLWRMATGSPVERTWVSLPEVSPALIQAVINAEDARFCLHSGVDWPDLIGVMRQAGGPRRGASTITMQTAKNLFLWHGRSYLRKALEIPLAMALDLVWSKSRILEVYLNIAEWGDGVFGVEAAARRAFGKSAAAITKREAVLLATALPNPVLRNPARPSRGHARIALSVGMRMAGYPEASACVR